MPERALNIGIDATSWTNERGYGRFTREIVKALAARGGSMRYTLLFDRIPDTTFPEGVLIAHAGTQRTLNETAVGSDSRSAGYLWRMGRAAARGNFDVFFFPTVYSYFPIPARVPCVVCYHDTTAERFPDLVFPTKLNRMLWRAKERLARWQTTRAMTVSQTSAADLENILGIPGSNIDVVTEGADPVFRILEDPEASARARASYQIPGGAPLLVYVGGLNPHKNLMGLLKAMRDVLAARPEVHLAIVGDVSGKGFWDNVAELKSFVAANAPLERHTHFTGFISDQLLAELLNAANALVFPSFWEGFGLPAVEAMACGLPVLASRVSSLPEVVGDAGLLFDPSNPVEISKCILQFMNDEDLQRRLRGNAIRRAATFSWDRGAELAETSLRRTYEQGRRRR